MINKQKLGMPERPGIKVEPKGTRENTGGGVQTYGDTELMEYNQQQGVKESGAIIKTEE